MGSKAIDYGGKDTGRDKLFCPCTCKVIRVRPFANGELYLESTEPVLWADGTIDYRRMLFMHDETNTDWSTGKIIKQGQYFYREGGMGNGKPNKFANHVHIEIGKGRFSLKQPARQSKNQWGTWVMKNQESHYNGFWIPKTTKILNGGGYNWKIDE